MDIQDLQPGDVLLFSGKKGSMISEAIMYLTESPVSHAAMTYTSSSDIVEEAPPAVRINNAWDRFERRIISVMRQFPSQHSYLPVLDAANGHLNNNQPYTNESLYTLGMLLVYKKFIPGIQTQKVMVRIFKKLASELLIYINQYTYPGKAPMVCSQLICRCYQEAGDNYRLSISNRKNEYEDTGEVSGHSLLRQVISRIKNDASGEFRNFIGRGSATEFGDEIGQSDEELAGDLLARLRDEPVCQGVALDKELIVAVHEFSQAMYTAETGIRVAHDELEYVNKQHMTTLGLRRLLVEEADFVTPGDLLNHCTNLRRIGEICI